MFDSFAKENNLQLKAKDDNGARNGGAAVVVAGAGAGATAANMSCGVTNLDAGSNHYSSVKDPHGDSRGTKDGEGGVGRGVWGGGSRVARISNFNRCARWTTKRWRRRTPSMDT